MESTVYSYPGFELLRVRTDKPSELANLNTSGFIRVEMRAGREHLAQMAEQGYSYTDRTIGVTINLKRATLDYEKQVRFPMRKAVLEDMVEILRIAQSSFPSDSRFHVRPNVDQHVADIILKSWVEKLSECYVCLNKERIIGFIDLEEISEVETFVHLAAVEERYRVSGAALSMYAYAVHTAKMSGYQKISGRISSANTAVMNLYAYLGGTFGEPLDVFVKEENK